MAKRKKKLTKAKAKEILEHGEARGHALTEKQEGFLGLIAGGGKPTRLKKKSKRRHNPSQPYGHGGVFAARGKLGIG